MMVRYCWALGAAAAVALTVASVAFGQQTPGARMFVRLEVVQFSEWVKTYDGFAPARKAAGITESTVWQSADDPERRNHHQRLPEPRAGQGLCRLRRSQGRHAQRGHKGSAAGLVRNQGEVGRRLTRRSAVNSFRGLSGPLRQGRRPSLR